MKYLQLLFFPALFVIYAFSLNRSGQGFQDIAAILMGIVGIVSAVISVLISISTSKYSWNTKWYVNIGISLLSCIITFVGLVIYARIAK